MNGGVFVQGLSRAGLCLSLSAVLFAGCAKTSSDGTDRMAGAAGASGAAGSTSAGRDPEPTVPESTALDPDAVALAATVLGACIPDDGVARNAGYMWSGEASNAQFNDRAQLQLGCLAHSGSGCAAIERCLGYSFSKASDCKPGCVGDVYTACGPDRDLPAGYRFSVDCQSVGLRCDPVGLCLDGAPIACDAASFVAGCNANGQPEYCDDGLVRHGPTCSDFALECTGKGCVGRGGSCVNSSGTEPENIDLQGVSCTGSKLSACVNQKLADIDCATQGPGFSCQHAGDKYFCGLAAECAPANEPGISTPMQCNGTTLQFCNAGRLEHVDCTSLGFSGCSLDKDNYGCTPGLAL